MRNKIIIPLQKYGDGFILILRTPIKVYLGSLLKLNLVKEN